jgi:hypothetical protein
MGSRVFSDGSYLWFDGEAFWRYYPGVSEKPQRWFGFGLPEILERGERDSMAWLYIWRSERRLAHWRFRLAGWIDDAKARLWGER